MHSHAERGNESISVRTADPTVGALRGLVRTADPTGRAPWIGPHGDATVRLRCVGSAVRTDGLAVRAMAGMMTKASMTAVSSCLAVSGASRVVGLRDDEGVRSGLMW